MSHQKGFSFLLVILVMLGVLVAGVYLLKEKQKEINQTDEQELVAKSSSGLNDSKPELTMEEMNEKFAPKEPLDEEDFYKGLNRDLPSEFKLYKNDNIGVSFEVPYNPDWGTKDFRPVPFEEVNYQNEVFLKLGPAVLFCEGRCQWNREYNLSITARIDSASLIKEKKEQWGQPEVFKIVPMTINNFEVLKIIEPGLCYNYTYTVIGKKYNYSFWKTCGSDDEEENNFIKLTIENLKLID